MPLIPSVRTVGVLRIMSQLCTAGVLRVLFGSALFGFCGSLLGCALFGVVRVTSELRIARVSRTTPQLPAARVSRAVPRGFHRESPPRITPDLLAVGTARCGDLCPTHLVVGQPKSVAPVGTERVWSRVAEV